MKKILSILCLLAFTACSYPVEETKTKDDQPTLIFKGASTSAEIYLNELLVGNAAEFNGDPKSLIIPRGTHLLEVKEYGKTLYSQKIFVSDGATKTIELTGK